MSAFTSKSWHFRLPLSEKGYLFSIKNNYWLFPFISGLILILCGLIPSIARADSNAESSVQNIRLWRAPDSTRLVFDLNTSLDHKIFELDNPNRLVIDLPPARFGADLKRIETKNTPIEKIRTGKRKGGGLRVVLDLNEKVKPRSFSLAPNESYGNRLVVDLFDRAEKVEKNVKDLTEYNRDIIIAIDAGHGGEDPQSRYLQAR